MKKVTFNRPRDDSATDSQDESDLDTSKSQGKLGRNYFKNIKIKGYDTTDELPKKLQFTWLDIIGITISICSFFFDAVMDVVVACLHYQNGNIMYFNLTLAFIAIPSLTMTGFSLRWYLIDADEKKIPPISYWKWVVRIVFLLLQMGPILRYIDSLCYGLKSNLNKSKVQKQTNYYKQMIYEDADATLLRLVECFLEAAPQLVLQLYIFAQPHTFNSNMNTWTEFAQMVSMFTSLLSMSWALASYQRALRYSSEDKKNMTWCGTVAQIIWRFLEIGSRVLALGLFASLFPLHMAIVCVVHYTVMMFWILTMKTDFCVTKCEEFLYNAVLAVVFIFCYFNPKDSPTRRRYSFFYSCIFLENTALMVVWFVFCPSGIAYKYPAMVVQFLGFTLGLIFMIIYYLLLHPTRNISILAHWTKSKPSECTIQNGDCNIKEVAQNVTTQENIM